MDTTYFITSAYNGIGASNLFAIRKYKGLTTINFNLSSLALGDAYPIKMKLDWGDSSKVILRSTTYNNITAMFGEIYSHEFNASDKMETYTPSLSIYYSNFTNNVHKMPIQVYRGSFYSEYKTLEIASTQFIDVSSNDMFVSFDTGYGDVLNLKLK